MLGGGTCNSQQGVHGGWEIEHMVRIVNEQIERKKNCEVDDWSNQQGQATSWKKKDPQIYLLSCFSDRKQIDQQTA